MVPVRLLLTGETFEVMRRLKTALESEGYEVTARGPRIADGMALGRHQPDVWITEAPATAAGRIRLSRAIDSYRLHRSLAVMVLGGDDSGSNRADPLEEAADLGIIDRPYREQEVLRRLDDWYRAWRDNRDMGRRAPAALCGPKAEEVRGLPAGQSRGIRRVPVLPG